MGRITHYDYAGAIFTFFSYDSVYIRHKGTGSVDVFDSPPFQLAVNGLSHSMASYNHFFAVGNLVKAFHGFYAALFKIGDNKRVVYNLSQGISAAILRKAFRISDGSFYAKAEARAVCHCNRCHKHLLKIFVLSFYYTILLQIIQYQNTEKQINLKISIKLFGCH